MTALGDLPEVVSFFGTDLKTGSLIIAALGIVHPMAFGCSFFMPLSYLLVTIWLLVACYFAASVCLFFGLNTVFIPFHINLLFIVFIDDTFLIALWIWYAVIFVVVMLMMMILLALVYTSRRQRSRVLVVILGMLWYILTVYFILVVNSHRNVLLKEKNLDQKITDKKF